MLFGRDDMQPRLHDLEPVSLDQNLTTKDFSALRLGQSVVFGARHQAHNNADTGSCQGGRHNGGALAASGPERQAQAERFVSADPDEPPVIVDAVLAEYVL